MCRLLGFLTLSVTTYYNTHFHSSMDYLLKDISCIILSSVWVAEWPPFRKKLITRLTICSHCNLTTCNLSYFLFCFEGWIWIPMASVPGLYRFYFPLEYGSIHKFVLIFSEYSH